MVRKIIAKKSERQTFIIEVDKNEEILEAILYFSNIDDRANDRSTGCSKANLDFSAKKNCKNWVISLQKLNLLYEISNHEIKSVRPLENFYWYYHAITTCQISRKIL